MNKKTFITILFTLVAMAGHAQIHYRLEGNIGRPDLTDTLSIVENRGLEKALSSPEDCVVRTSTRNSERYSTNNNSCPNHFMSNFHLLSRQNDAKTGKEKSPNC